MSVRLIFAGTPQAAVPSLQRLLGSDHDVVAVLTRPDAPVGRGRRMARSPVAEVADAAGIPVLQPTGLRDPEVVAQLAALAPDACPVVAYGLLIPAPVLAVPTFGWVNLHFSLLPAWRGAAPVQHAIAAGDDLTGATTFLLDEGMDTGPVLGTLTEAISPRDTAGDLLDRLSVSGAELLVATIDALAADSLVPVPQPPEGVSLAPKITVADAEVRWDTPAFAVDRHIRSCTPTPGAWTTARGERVKLGPVRPDDSAAALPPGVLAVEGKNTWRVGTATVPVVLGEVRPAGKKVMSAADWLRGLRPEPGESFT